jgi:RNA polymerase sigma factor (sigma-70 family)
MSVTLAEMTSRFAASSAPRMPDTTIDAETTRLAQQAQAGSAEAFCALVDLHQRAARRVAATALGQSPDVDEAVQDACITAWQRIDRLEDPAAFRAWLLRITWRKALDRRRSITSWLKRFVGPPRVSEEQGEGPGAPVGRSFSEGGSLANRTSRGTSGLGKPARPGPAAPGTGAPVGPAGPGFSPAIDNLADPAPLADEQLLARERDLVVAQMIQSLPTRLRDPFLLAATGEHRYEDIAALLAIPLGTVKWRVAEARRMLRDKLQRVGFGQERGPRGPRART